MREVTRTFILAASCLLVVFAMAACEGEVGPAGPAGADGTDGQDGLNPAATCFVCHSDSNTALVAAGGQYGFSIHASGNNIDRNSSSCTGCHVSEGFIVRTFGGTPGSVSNPTAIHCFTCHKPHTAGDLGLRATTPAALKDGTTFDFGAANICVWCHQALQNVNTYVTTPNDTTNVVSHWGPHHSVQGDMLIGTNGYEYASYTYTQTDHRGMTIEGCKDCHFDETSNYRVGGHSFNMTYVDVAETFENTAPCENCHGSTADFDYHSVQTETEALLLQLNGLLQTANLLDAGGSEVIRTVAANDSAGALWNYLMVEEDRSHGVHNKNYIQSLLRSAIIFLGGVPVF